VDSSQLAFSIATTVIVERGSEGKVDLADFRKSSVIDRAPSKFRGETARVGRSELEGRARSDSSFRGENERRRSKSAHSEGKLAPRESAVNAGDSEVS